MEKIKQYVLLAVVVLLLLAAMWRCGQLNSQLAEEKERHVANIEALTDEVERIVLDDSSRAAQVAALTLRANDAERLCERLRKLNKQLGIRTKDVSNVTEVVSILHDTVFLSKEESRVSDSIPCYAYNDAWASLEVCLHPDTLSLAYSFRDTVDAIVHVQYQKRFLWWRWKPQYKATVVSHCPRSEIKGVTSVVIDEE